LKDPKKAELFYTVEGTDEIKFINVISKVNNDL